MRRAGIATIGRSAFDFGESRTIHGPQGIPRQKTAARANVPVEGEPDMNLRLFPPPAMNRRGFLRAASAMTLSAASYSRVGGANGRLGYALVGCGTRGRYVS